MAIVVSDTSAIAALFHLGHINLLASLFVEVIIPPAVAQELMYPQGPRPRVDIAAFSYVKIQQPTDHLQVLQLKTELEAGESEAIALAIELSADWLLIDEFDGRHIAARHGLRAMGVLGVLVMAKAAGFIPLVGPLMERLISEIDFRISRTLRQQVLKLAGE